MTSSPCLPQDAKEISGMLGDVANDFSGKTVLMAGGMGFLGRYFQGVFEYLNANVLAEPCRLIIADNMITAGKAGEALTNSDNFEFSNVDISNGFEVEGSLDYIVNLAGIASPYYYRAYPVETLDVAVNGTRHLLELARDKGARFTFFSSSEIYGDPDPVHIPTPESYRGNVSCQGPRACYDESKRLGETLCYIYHDKYGIPTNTIRPFNVYGPGMQEADYRVLPNFASCIKGGRPLKVYGTGNQTRTFCYVTDAINGFLRVIARGVPGQAYNIGNPTPEISVFELVTEIEKVLGKSIDKEVIEYPDSYPADEPNRRCPDIVKARRQLEFHPEVTIADGLKRFFDWTDDTYVGEE
jgi:UDP-glucuronate decarboxylase